MGWFCSFLLIWLFPSTVALFNPFLAPISRAIQERKLTPVLWSSYLTGLLRDIILSSPRLGLLGFSSLVTSALVYRLSRLLALEGWQGSFVVALLAVGEFFCDSVFCYVVGRSEGITFAFLFTWKSYFLFVVFSCVWAFLLRLCAIVVHWCTRKLFRRTSS